MTQSKPQSPCGVFFVDDTKNPHQFSPLPNLIATDLKTAMRVLEHFEPEIMYLDYYLTTGSGTIPRTGLDIINRMRYKRMKWPKRIILISSDESCNQRMAVELLNAGYCINVIKGVVKTPHDVTPMVLDLKDAGTIELSS